MDGPTLSDVDKAVAALLDSKAYRWLERPSQITVMGVVNVIKRMVNGDDTIEWPKLAHSEFADSCFNRFIHLAEYKDPMEPFLPSVRGKPALQQAAAYIEMQNARDEAVDVEHISMIRVFSWLMEPEFGHRLDPILIAAANKIEEEAGLALVTENQDVPLHDRVRSDNVKSAKIDEATAIKAVRLPRSSVIRRCTGTAAAGSSSSAPVPSPSGSKKASIFGRSQKDK